MVRHPKPARAHIDQAAFNVHSLGVMEPHLNRSARGTARLAAFLMRRHSEACAGSEPYNFNLRLSVRREIPSRAAARC